MNMKPIILILLTITTFVEIPVEISFITETRDPYFTSTVLPGNYIMDNGMTLINGNIFGFSESNSDPTFFVDLPNSISNITMQFGGTYPININATIVFARANAPSTGTVGYRVYVDNYAIQENWVYVDENEPLNTIMQIELSNKTGKNITIYIEKIGDGADVFNCTITVYHCLQVVPYFVEGYMLGSGWFQHLNTTLVVYPNETTGNAKIGIKRANDCVFRANITTMNVLKFYHKNGFHNVGINGTGYRELFIFAQYPLYIIGNTSIINATLIWEFDSYINPVFCVYEVYTTLPISIYFKSPVNDICLMIIRNEWGEVRDTILFNTSIRYTGNFSNGLYIAEFWLMSDNLTEGNYLLANRTFIVSVSSPSKPNNPSISIDIFTYISYTSLFIYTALVALYLLTILRRKKRKQ